MEHTSLTSHYIHLLLDIVGLSEIQGLEHFETMLGQTPTLYYVAIVSSLASCILAWILSHRDSNSDTDASDGDNNTTNKSKTSENSQTEESTKTFEISPTDECEFVPLVSHEEDRKLAAEMAPKTKYIPLDPINPSAQVNAYLNALRGEEAIEEDSEDSQNSDSFYKDDIGKYVKDKDLQVLADPRESPSRQGSVMSRVKKARQRAIQKSVEKDMNADDHLKEQLAANQMLSRIYTVMRENKEMFGETNFDEVKAQMDLYKP